MSHTDQADVAIPGMPPNFGQSILPHVMTFAGISAAIARVYRPTDEAIRDSAENARFMRNDPAVMECVEARQRACALLNWHIEPEDDKDPRQKDVCDQLTQLLKTIPRFTQYRENLLHAVWFGKYGISHTWQKKMVRRKMRTVLRRWTPIHGDKIVFNWDREGKHYDEDSIGIRVGWGYKAGDQLVGGFRVERIERPHYSQVEATEFGLAYFLQPKQRSLIALHKHYIEDGEFETPEFAGRIHGVGVRSRIYWAWYQKQETLAWLMEYLERSAQGFEVWYFPAGNAEAEAKTRIAAQERISTRNIILCPYFPEETSRPPYERIEPSMAGAQAMKEIVTEYFGHLIKRYILGQTLTSEQGSTGLGSNLADIHMGTFMQIIRYDATNLEETITNDLLQPFIRYNIPEWSAYDFKFVIDTESDDSQEKIKAAETGWRMGLKIKSKDMYDLLGLSKPTSSDEVLSQQQQQQEQGQGAAPGGAGAGSAVSPDLITRVASQLSAAISNAGQSRVTSPATAAIAGDPPAEEYQANVDSQNSERVKLRTYSAMGIDSPGVARLKAMVRHAGRAEKMLIDTDVVPLDKWEAWDRQGYSPADIVGLLLFDHEDSIEHYRKNVKSSPGQKSLFDMEPDPEFEQKHPRDDDGKFAPAGGGGYTHGIRKKPSRKNKGEADEVDEERDSGMVPTGERPGKDADEAHERVPSGNLEGTDRKRRRRKLPTVDGSGEPGNRTRVDGGGDEPVRRETDSIGGDATAGGERSDETVQVGSGGAAGDGSGGGGKDVRIPKPKKPKGNLSEGNYRYETTSFIPQGAKSKVRANIAAIKVLRTMEAEDRTEATPEEKEILSKYVGWGAFAQNLFSSTSYAGRKEWEKERESLSSLLTDDEYNAAKASTKNAHFTSPEIVQWQWEVAKKLGFKGGRFLEPSVGVGYYMGLMPDDVAKNTKTTAIELDPISARITAALYPAATVKNQGFETYSAPDNFHDLVASNFPFGAYKIYEKRYSKHNANIHDHFFLKSVDLAKPGGLVMGITSTGTLDNPESEHIRKAIHDQCDLVGAVRMPNRTHKDNAGTDVVTDMLIFRKRPAGVGPAGADTPTEAEPEKPGFTGVTTDSLGRVYHWVNGKRVPGDSWLKTTKVSDPFGGADIEVNQYFAENPQQVLGQIDRSGEMYQGDSKGVSGITPADVEKMTGRKAQWNRDNTKVVFSDGSKVPDELGDQLLKQRLQEALDRLPANITQTSDQEVKEKTPAVERVKQSGLHIDENGTVFQRQGAEMVPVDVKPEVMERIKGQLAIRDAAHELIAAQLNGQDSDGPREKLNSLYDSFVEKHGPLNDKNNRRALGTSDDALFLASLEKWEGGKANKTDMFTKDTVRALNAIDSAENIEQGYTASLHQRGIVDPAYIAALMGQSQDEVEDELLAKGIAYDDPHAGGWKSSAEYLSGNVRKKLAQAKAAAETDPRYKAHVEALEKHQPEDIDSVDIHARLGAGWIPPADMARFAAEMVGSHPHNFTAEYNKAEAKWLLIPQYKSAYNTDLATSLWTVKSGGKVQVDFGDIFAHAISSKPIRIGFYDDEKKFHLNQQATDDANAKVQELKSRFKDWLFSDEDRRTRLTALYNEQCNNIVPMRYDGSHLQFPGIQGKELRGPQKDFVWRVLTTGRGLAGHEVGTGKTSTMVAAAMELRRLGLAKKPCIVALKSNIEQLVAEAQAMYPTAKILSTSDHFTAKERKEVVARIATGDYDMVFMTHDHLGSLPMEPAAESAFVQKEIDSIREAIEEANRHSVEKGKKSTTVKNLEKKLSNATARLRALADIKKDDLTTFEQTGIDMLMVDEAHHFKSLPVTTQMGNMKGVPTGQSKKAFNMLMKAHYLLDKNNGRGVVFATGTPVANTMAEMYNMQRFLQPDQLRESGLEHFDAWAAQFTDTAARGEFTVAGDYKQVTRLREFGNIPELMAMAGQVVDIKRVNDFRDSAGELTIKRPKRTDHTVISSENDAMNSYMDGLRARANRIKGTRQGVKGADNMLAICSDGRKAAVDLRLVDANAPDDPNSKSNQCVKKVLELYHANPGKTQAIFSDVGVRPIKTKEGESDDDEGATEAESSLGSNTSFHLYDDIKKKLIAGGIKPEEIADFSILKGAARIEAQKLLRSGKMRIALGGTKRLGTGTNIQKQLMALHHLDVPLVPADIEQRDGRAWRQGNTNKEIGIYRYVAEKSLDQALWQIVGNKSRFIKQVTGGDPRRKGQRNAIEEDTEELSPEQLMAAASGDTRFVRKADLHADLTNLSRAKDVHQRQQNTHRDTIAKSASKREAIKAAADHHRATQAHIEKTKDFSFIVGSQWHKDRASAEAAIGTKMQEVEKAWEDEPSWQREPVQIGSYRGLRVTAHPSGIWLMKGPTGEMYRSGPSLQSLEHAVRSIPKRITDLESQDSQVVADIEQIKGLVGKEFPHEDRLKAVRAEYDALEKEIREEKEKEKAAKKEADDKGKKETPIEKYARQFDEAIRYALTHRS